MRDGRFRHSCCVKRRLLNFLTALSFGVFLVVLVGTACHLLFRPNQSALVKWTTHSHQYRIGFKAFGFQFHRTERWPPGGPGAVAVVRQTHLGNQVLMYMTADAVDASGATTHAVLFQSIGLPLLSPLVLPAIWLVRHRRTRRRNKAGRCPACGYDLRATPGRCPECGRTPSVSRTG